MPISLDTVLLELWQKTVKRFSFMSWLAKMLQWPAIVLSRMITSIPDDEDFSLLFWPPNRTSIKKTNKQQPKDRRQKTDSYNSDERAFRSINRSLYRYNNSTYSKSPGNIPGSNGVTKSKKKKKTPTICNVLNVKWHFKCAKTCFYLFILFIIIFFNNSSI